MNIEDQLLAVDKLIAKSEEAITTLKALRVSLITRHQEKTEGHSDFKKMKFGVTQYKALRAAYKKAVAEDKACFTFNGHELVTGYAKFMLEYLAPKFPRV